MKPQGALISICVSSLFIKMNICVDFSARELLIIMIWANKMSMSPAKTQISLGVRPVWSESSLCAWRKLGSLATR